MSRRHRPVALSPIAQRFNMRAWIERHMVMVEDRQPEMLCVCPKCSRPKLAVNVSLRAFRCLYAGCSFAGWDPLRLVQGVRDCTTADAEREMEAFAIGAMVGPVTLPRRSEAGERTRIPVGTWPPHGPLGPAQENWLRRRKVPREHWDWFGLKTAYPQGNGQKADRILPGRVLIPAYVDRLPVFWSARHVQDRHPKTVNMPRACRHYGHPEDCTCFHAEWGLPPVPYAVAAGDVVLGLHLVRAGQPVIVVEGDADALVCGPGFVATYGAHLTEAQAALIAATGASEAIVLFDGDQGGEDSRWKAQSVLERYIPTRTATCPVGEDPGSLGREAALAIAAEAPAAGSLAAPRGSWRNPSPKVEARSGLIRKLRMS